MSRALEQKCVWPPGDCKTSCYIWTWMFSWVGSSHSWIRAPISSWMVCGATFWTHRYVMVLRRKLQTEVQHLKEPRHLILVWQWVYSSDGASALHMEVCSPPRIWPTAKPVMLKGVTGSRTVFTVQWRAHLSWYLQQTFWLQIRAHTNTGVGVSGWKKKKGWIIQESVRKDKKRELVCLRSSQKSYQFTAGLS